MTENEPRREQTEAEKVARFGRILAENRRCFDELLDAIGPMFEDEGYFAKNAIRVIFQDKTIVTYSKRLKEIEMFAKHHEATKDMTDNEKAKYYMEMADRLACEEETKTVAKDSRNDGKPFVSETLKARHGEEGIENKIDGTSYEGTSEGRPYTTTEPMV